MFSSYLLPLHFHFCALVLPAGTDRNNLVQIPDRKDNFPLPYESSTMWEAADVVWHSHGRNILDKKDLALGFASAGYYE